MKIEQIYEKPVKNNKVDLILDVKRSNEVDTFSILSLKNDIRNYVTSKNTDKILSECFDFLLTSEIRPLFIEHLKQFTDYDLNVAKNQLVEDFLVMIRKEPYNDDGNLYQSLDRLITKYLKLMDFETLVIRFCSILVNYKKDKYVCQYALFVLSYIDFTDTEKYGADIKIPQHCYLVCSTMLKNSKDEQILDSLLQVLENFGDEKSLEILKSVKMEIVWLENYRLKLIDDISENLK